VTVIVLSTNAKAKRSKAGKGRRNSRDGIHGNVQIGSGANIWLQSPEVIMACMANAQH
jgi:hypothetical protein